MKLVVTFLHVLLPEYSLASLPEKSGRSFIHPSLALNVGQDLGIGLSIVPMEKDPCPR